MDKQIDKSANLQRAAATAISFRTQLHWLKAQSFASDIASLTASLPHNRAADAIANQLVRSAGSIAANIAGGYGCYSQAAYRHYLSIARGSAMRQDFVSGEEGRRLIDACIEIQKLLTFKMKGLPPAKGNSIRDEDGDYEA